LRTDLDEESRVDSNKSLFDYLEDLRFDSTTLALIVSNALTIVYAIREGWDVRDVMWIYWGQSVIIGVFNTLRILDLREFTTEGFKLNDRPVEPTRKTRRQTAAFFVVHYGFFHAMYAAFLSDESKPFQSGHAKETGILLLIFLANHAYSYIQNRERDRSRVPNIGTIMFMPYARIIPMHLTILFGHFVAWVGGAKLVMFLLLKTFADVVMHSVEHSEARGSTRQPTQRSRHGGEPESP
jgi:hypothetical protein